VKITADTNLLVRAAMDDHPRQAELARSQLSTAEVVALSSQAICEFVWVVRRGYGRSAHEAAAAIRALLASDNVIADARAIDAGLALLEGGGDFADGVIAYEGRWLGADEFVSFDRKAVRLVQAQGGSARLLA
jgi:predicted nucleic-acid-binding protein